MSIFVDENTKVVVQGLTGGQGRFHGLRNRDYGTQIVAGVTPGKGGTDVDGVPVYDSVGDAVAATGADASFVVVPPKAAPAAILEALDRVEISSPIVLRLDGTNAVAGREILAAHLSDRLVAEPTMLDAARRAVALAGGQS